jgi:hypothetical protein
MVLGLLVGLVVQIYHKAVPQQAAPIMQVDVEVFLFFKDLYKSCPAASSSCHRE